LVVTPEHVGPLRVGSTMAELDRVCPGAYTELITLGGIQGPGHVFTFPGAKVTAADFDCPFDGDCPTGVPGYWLAIGDSVRAPDGAIIPRTIGEARRRYGAIWLINVTGDDATGPDFHICRFSKLYFVIDDAVPKEVVNPSDPKLVGVSDTSRIRGIHFEMTGLDPGDRYCPTAH
jgi:hypothetical protein